MGRYEIRAEGVGNRFGPHFSSLSAAAVVPAWNLRSRSATVISLIGDQSPKLPGVFRFFSLDTGLKVRRHQNTLDDPCFFMVFAW